MKKIAKAASLILQACLLGSILFSVCACGGSGTAHGVTEAIDPTRTQLYVSNFNGGYGDEWLQAIKERFEAEKADEHYEEGKTGVQIMIANEMIGGKDLLNTLSSSPNHVFFNETVNYYDAVASGKVLDITDMIQEKLPGEEESIYDKLNSQQKEYMSIDGRYYMIPHYEAFYGITIDVDLFDGKRLFFGQDGEINYTSANKEQLSAGPDRESGTYDDGLPATYDEFFKLVDTMKTRGVTPVTWAGDCQFYATRLVEAMAADVNGADNTLTGIRFTGELDNVVSAIGSDGTVTTQPPVAIDAEKGYLTMQQDGYYYGLQFMDKLVSDELNYYDRTFTSGQSQTDTQMDYLLSNKDAEFEKPIAMLVDGCWWESEATETFNSMEGSYENASKAERRFRFIPFPKPAGHEEEGQTLLEINNAYGFIRSNIDEVHKDLAIEFLQYCYTDVSLKEFTKITSATKGVSYEMEEADLAECTYYGRSLMELKSAPDTQVVYQLSDSALYRENLDSFVLGERFRYGVYVNPSTVFETGQENAESYFNGFTQNWQSNWNSMFGKYFVA